MYPSCSQFYTISYPHPSIELAENFVLGFWKNPNELFGQPDSFRVRTRERERETWAYSEDSREDLLSWSLGFLL